LHCEVLDLAFEFEEVAGQATPQPDAGGAQFSANASRVTELRAVKAWTDWGVAFSFMQRIAAERERRKPLSIHLRNAITELAFRQAMGCVVRTAGPLFDAINAMLLDMLAAVARKDYDDRRRRQSQGIARAKAAGLYRGRPEDTKRSAGIAAMLRDGMSWSAIQDAAGCGRATIAKVARRGGDRQ
jgi:hypothetical protein